ncbi:hypothetical protein ACJIZ3_025219 [Penstemon smallii]|uniref:Uncharacterized protein n=1 Tax=Penstemon smallii TaxID=265156 RepID=A0ABD3TWJ8_9LAMI
MTPHGAGVGAARTKIYPVAAKPCDYCNSTAALVFCLADSAFICMMCDTKIHNTNHKHERVWMCDVCEQAPAAFNCKADAAVLCVSCDRDIHSANPLARRHERTPVVPFYDTAESMVMKSIPFLPTSDHDRKLDVMCNDYTPGLSIISSKPTNIIDDDDDDDMKSMDFFLFPDSSREFLDFDSVVPEQTTIKPPIPCHQYPSDQINRFEIDFSRSNNINSYSTYTTPSLSHSVSSSSMDVGIVPDVSAMSDISYPLARNIDMIMSGNIQTSPVVGSMDREARVLRYKEKRKNRKFEKTIRYASRKAYAEARPRIKGRFAKRTDSDSDMDRIFGSGSANFIADARFGIVPSF